jgi:hypothetical protein
VAARYLNGTFQLPAIRSVLQAASEAIPKSNYHPSLYLHLLTRPKRSAKIHLLSTQYVQLSGGFFRATQISTQTPRSSVQVPHII